MRGSRWFILSILIFLVVMFAIEYHLPKSFVWVPTFSHNDKQPFGCAVFDSLLVSSLPAGYRLSRKTIYQLEQEDTVHNSGILVVAKETHMGDVDVKALLKMVDRGNKVMLVSSSFSKNLEDTLRFACTSSYFNPMALKKYATSFLKKDSLCWVGDSTIYPQQTFFFYPQLCSSNLRNDTCIGKILAQKSLDIEQVKNEDLPSDTTYNYPVAITRPLGKGEIILVSTPLLFTNYGVLDGRNATYIFRLLSQMDGLPIIRTEGYTKETAQEVQSPFRFLLSQPPLRWALYVTMMTIVLFLIFTARRRQRVIPVMREPENKSLEFTELIGTLYYQKKNHADLVRKKFTYFAEELRREIQVDIEEVAEDERTFRRIAQKTGMDEEEISRFVKDVRPITYGDYVVTDTEMKQYIDKMNEIIKHL